jgi:hypothetical protein
MPIEKRSFFVAVCKHCQKVVDFQGDGGFTVTKTRQGIKDWIDGNGVKSIEEACGCKDSIVNLRPITRPTGRGLE